MHKHIVKNTVRDFHSGSIAVDDADLHLTIVVQVDIQSRIE